MFNIIPIQKSLSHPILNSRTNPNIHVSVFYKGIQANGEKNNSYIINFICFTWRDKVLKWGENFMLSHARCTFEKLETTFYKHYHKVQNDEQVYMALCMIKQVTNKKMEMDTQISKLLARQGKWKLVHHLNSCSTGTILTNHNCKNEKKHFVWTQRSY